MIESLWLLLIDSSNERHQAPMQRMRKRLRFGKYRALRWSGCGTFNGRWTKMDKDFSHVYISPKRKRELQMAVVWECRFEALGTAAKLTSVEEIDSAETCQPAPSNQAFERDCRCRFCVSTDPSRARGGVWTLQTVHSVRKAEFQSWWLLGVCDKSWVGDWTTLSSSPVAPARVEQSNEYAQVHFQLKATCVIANGRCKLRHSGHQETPQKMEGKRVCEDGVMIF